MEGSQLDWLYSNSNKKSTQSVIKLRHPKPGAKYSSSIFIRFPTSTLKLFFKTSFEIGIVHIKAVIL